MWAIWTHYINSLTAPGLVGWSKKIHIFLKMNPPAEFSGYRPGCYRMEMNSKAFAIPILTATYIVNYKLDAIRIGIANDLEFISIL